MAFSFDIGELQLIQERESLRETIEEATGRTNQLSSEKEELDKEIREREHQKVAMAEEMHQLNGRLSQEQEETTSLRAIVDGLEKERASVIPSFFLV